MQFPVPQFTDVEDRIVGGLTFKQFGVVFVAGVLVFAIYTISKSIVGTIIAGIILGFPALVVAFGKLNGRPIYSSFGNALSFITGQKIYFFQKQAHQLPSDQPLVQISEEQPVMGVKEKTVKIQELSYLLHQQREQEAELIRRLKENKTS